MNHEKLSKVAEVVRGNEGREVSVKVLRVSDYDDDGEGEGRGDQELELNLVPRSGWGGRGLLGCHLVPV